MGMASTLKQAKKGIVWLDRNEGKSRYAWCRTKN